MTTISQGWQGGSEKLRCGKVSVQDVKGVLSLEGRPGQVKMRTTRSKATPKLKSYG